jgi:hypothetical protein
LCLPAAAAIPLAIASTVVSAGAQLYAGSAQRNQANYEAAVAQQNRNLELQARSRALEQNTIDQTRHWRRVSQQIGDQVARQAASGLDVSFGSSADLIGDAAAIGYEDSALINRNTVEQIRGYEINASNYEASGRAAKARGKAAMVGSILSATGTILGGAKQISNMSSPSFGG